MNFISITIFNVFDNGIRVCILQINISFSWANQAWCAGCFCRPWWTRLPPVQVDLLSALEPFGTSELMSEESDSLYTSSSVASLSENERPPLFVCHCYVCSLTEDLVTNAWEELQEKPEWQLQDVQALRDTVQGSTPPEHVPRQQYFSAVLLSHQQVWLDWSLQLLVNYHSCRRNWPEGFSNLSPLVLKDVLSPGFLTMQHHPGPRGCHILCIDPNRWILSNYSITENMWAIYLILEKLFLLKKPRWFIWWLSTYFLPYSFLWFWS